MSYPSHPGPTVQGTSAQGKRGTPIPEDGNRGSLEPANAPARRGPLRAFAYPQFRIFWFASLLSIISFFMSMIARGWLVLDMTDSAFMVTAINAVGLLPMLLFSLFGGVVADLMDRRLVLLASDGFNLVVVVVLGILVVTDTIQVWQVYVLTVLHGTGFALGTPARAAMVSMIVGQRDLSSGVALFTTIFSSGQMVGPALAGFLITAFGMGVPFLMGGVFLVPALFTLLKLKLPETGTEGPAPAKASVFQSIGQGIVYVRNHSVLIGLMLLGLATTVFAMPYQTLLPVFARDILHAGSSGLGWLGGMAGAGAILGSITVASFSSPRQMRVLMLTGGLGLGAFIVLFALSTNYLLSLALVFTVGFLFQIFMTSNFTMVQVIAPDYIRGRVLSIRMLAIGLGPIGMVLLGTGAQMFGPAVATAALGTIATVLIIAILVLIPSLRRVETVLQEQPSHVG